MHPDLETWLNQVWADRQKIIELSPTGHSGRGVHLGDKNPAIWAVYRMYNESEGVSSSDVSAVASFIDELDGLEKAVATAATLQVGNEFVYLNRGALSSSKASPFTARTSKTQKEVTVNQAQVGKSFVHFLKDAKLLARYRVYINVQRAVLGGVFRNLMSALWNERLLHSGKVTGPLGSVRADSVVIYLGDGPRDTAVEKIRAYYDKNKGQFGITTPKLTVPIEGMPGVALGMEPPSLAVIRSGGEYYAEEMGQSFGFYRAMLIFMALDRTHWTQSGQSDLDRCNAYKRRAEKYFKQAGIDPDRPAEQTDPTGLKPIESLKREIEGAKDEDGDYKPGAKVHIKK